MNVAVNLVLDLFSGMATRLSAWFHLRYLGWRSANLKSKVEQYEELEVKRKTAEEDYKRRIEGRLNAVKQQQKTQDSKPVDVKKRTDFENLS